MDTGEREVLYVRSTKKKAKYSVEIEFENTFGPSLIPIWHKDTDGSAYLEISRNHYLVIEKWSVDE
jgi:hypothetical protein